MPRRRCAWRNTLHSSNAVVPDETLVESGLPDCGQISSARQRPHVARSSCQWMGRAYPLCPGTSDINLLRYRERVVNVNAEISDGAFDLRVAQQKLDGPKIAGAPIDQGRLCPSQR